MLSRGQQAIDFVIPTPDGPDGSLFSLASSGPVVLYFYPADFTPVCSAEACMFRDAWSELQSAGIHVVGVSPQKSDSHQQFAAKFSLPFPLVADPGRSIIHAYGCTWLLGLGVRRASFLIDQNRVIQDRVVADFLVARHRAFIARAIRYAGHASS